VTASSNPVTLYESPLGLRRDYTYAGQVQVDDQESLQVNVTNGNLVLQADDFSLPGVAGFGFDFTRYYNSLYSSLSTLSNPTIAPGWEDVPNLAFFSNGDARYAGESGYEVVFHKSGTSYNSTPGIDATLVQQQDGTFLLTFHKTGVEEKFSSTGQLLDEIDRNGNTIAFTWTSGRLTGITDTSGRTTSLTYNGSSQLTSITAPCAGAPPNFSGTASSTGGSLATGTYYYEVTAVSSGRESPVSSQINKAVTGPTGSVALTWTALPGATSYKIYRGTTSNGENTYYTSTTNSFTDTGAAGTSGTPPAASGVCTYSYTYNANGQLASFTDPTSGQPTNYGYNAAGLLSTITNPLGCQTQIAYDGQNRVQTITSGVVTGSCPTGGRSPSTSFAYSGSFCSGETDFTDANTHVTTYCSDSRDRVYETKDPLGNITRSDYTDTANGGSNCVNASGYTLDDRPCATKSPLGNFWTAYGYDSTGQNLLWSQNPQQTSTQRPTWAYGDSAHPYYPTSFTDADGNTTNYTYDANGNLKTKLDGAQNETSYTYYANGELNTKQDGLNNLGACPGNETCPTTTYNSYNSYGDVTSETDGRQNTSTFAYDPVGNTTRSTDPLGHGHYYTYDADGRQLSERDPLGHTKTYGYDAAGNQTSETDGLNSSDQCAAGTTCPTTSEGYDANNLLLTETSPPNQRTTTYSYDGNGNLLTELDPDQNETLYAYDADNHQISEQDGLNNLGACPANSSCPTTQFSYDADGNLLAETDGRVGGYGNVYVYNSSDELTSETDGVQFSSFPSTYSCVTGTTCTTTGYVYDPAGNQTSVLDGNNVKTVSSYDGNNRVHIVTTGLNSAGQCTGAICPQTITNYDNNGNQQNVTTGLNSSGQCPTGAICPQTDYTYNADNQLSTLTSGLNSSGTCPTGSTCPETTYTYYADGTLDTQVSPNGNVSGGTPANYTTTNTYYTDGTLHTTTDPIGNVTTDTYDNLGNLKTEQTSKGTITNCYDAASELTSTYYSAVTCGTGTPDVSYSYDAAGNRLQMSTTGAYGQITETSHYTNLELPDTITTSEPISSTNTLTAQFAYQYDGAGNVTQLTYPDGTNTYYNYDNRDLMCRVATASGTACNTTGQTVAYTYDGDGNLLTATHPSGYGNFTETRGYDNANRLASIQSVSGSNTIAKFAYTLDANGNPTQTVRTGWNPNPADPSFDLTCTMSYSYDNNLRLTGSTYSSGTTGCPTNSGDAYSFSWNYDADGNWTKSVGQATTYYLDNGADQLCATSSTGPPSSCSANYTYDGNGNETKDGATNNQYQYNLANQLTSITSGGSSTSATYDGDGKQLSSGTTYYFWDVNTPDGQPHLALEENSSGIFLKRYIYGLNRISETVLSPNHTDYYVDDGLGSPSNLVTGAGTVDTTYSYEPYGGLRQANGTDTLRFAGLQWAGNFAGSDLYNANNVYYDSNTGRFLSQDISIGAAASAYAYGNDNPAADVGTSGETSSLPLSNAAPSGASVAATPSEMADRNAGKHAKVPKCTKVCKPPGRSSAPISAFYAYQAVNDPSAYSYGFYGGYLVAANGHSASWFFVTVLVVRLTGLALEGGEIEPDVQEGSDAGIKFHQSFPGGGGRGLLLWTVGYLVGSPAKIEFKISLDLPNQTPLVEVGEKIATLERHCDGKRCHIQLSSQHFSIP
jgi:RHS repeat-associated protein